MLQQFIIDKLFFFIYYQSQLIISMGNSICDAISEKEFKAGVRSLDLFRKMSQDRKDVQSEVDKIDFPEELGHSEVGVANVRRQKLGKSRECTHNGIDRKDKMDTAHYNKDNKDKLDVIEKKVNKLISDLNDNYQNKQLSTQANTCTSKQQKSTDQSHFFPHKPTNLNTLYLEHSLQQEPYTAIAFPFNVIRLILDPVLIRHISEEDPNFFTKYKDDETSFKLLKSGCYGNVMGEGYGVFVNVGYYYQGGFIESGNGDIVPYGRGVYVTAKGKYVGEFNGKGEMSGKGKYYHFVDEGGYKDRSPKITQTWSQHSYGSNNLQSPSHKPQAIIYQGLFQHNTLAKGSILHSSYKYQGSLLNRKPHGFGKLHLLTTNTTYKGEFKSGKFDGKRATYETDQYTYVGDFVEGKKEGYGVLVRKIKGRKGDGKGLRPNQRQGESFDGYWRDDRFVGYAFDGVYQGNK